MYELDPVTGAATLIGPTGVEVVSGMSLRVRRYRGHGGRESGET